MILLDKFFPPDTQLKPLRYGDILLFISSLAGLYTEIMLIRWIGTEVRIFAFFQNLALITCFLGFGLGCYLSHRRKNPAISLGAISILAILVNLPVPAWKQFLIMNSGILTLSPDAALWGFNSNISDVQFYLLFIASILIVGLFLLLLIVAMIPFGQLVAYYLDKSARPVRSYSVDLAGSIFGIWLMVVLAFNWLSPEYWFTITAGLIILLNFRSKKSILSSLALLGISLIFLNSWNIDKNRSETYWSPYQKLTVDRINDSGEYMIYVNNIGYLSILDLSRERQDKFGTFSSPYDIPFRFAEKKDRALIVGAGAGNDAAGALRNGVEYIDAVEIDPVILSLGKNLHPEDPYNSPRVNKILTDARAYLKEEHEPYDIIIFGLLDSHTQFSDFSNMRIDNYVYTEEAFKEAKKLLKPDGILILKFEVRDPWQWMGERFYSMLYGVFGKEPVVFSSPEGGWGTTFVVSQNDSLKEKIRAAGLREYIELHPPIFSPNKSASIIPTDNWPYVYHRYAAIPRTYFTVSLIILALAVFLTHGIFNIRQKSSRNLFLLGGGFLLMETQMISRLALYFGTTWIINGIAITAILSVLLAANYYVTRFKPGKLDFYYYILIASLFSNYLIPWEKLPFSAETTGILLSTAFSISIFFAGIIFTETFRRSENKSQAFGANILGSVAGGLSQNISFILGMKSLLILAGMFYLAAFITSGRKGFQK